MLVPPGGLAAPPTGNPESAPGGRGTLKEKRQCEILITSLCVEIPSLKKNQFSSWTVFCSPNFCCTRRLSFACKVVFSFNFAPNELSAHYADDSITVNYRLFTVQFLFASVSPAQCDLQITCYQRIKVAFSPLSPRLHCITLIMNLLIFFLMSQSQESQLLPTWCV